MVSVISQLKSYIYGRVGGGDLIHLPISLDRN